jgi:Ras-related protein Rab-11A
MSSNNSNNIIDNKASNASFFNNNEYNLEEITTVMASQMVEDYLFKIIVIGDCAVGKSNILSRYTKNIFSKESKSTVGVELSSKVFKIDNKLIKVNIWDTAGQERFTSITSAYYKGAHGAFVVYDITRKETFENVDKWISELRLINGNNILIILIGNKSDLKLLRKINAGEANFKANQLGINFFEVSALDSSNIHKAFEEMIKEIYVRTKLGGGNFDNFFPLNKKTSTSQLGNNNEEKCNC